MPSIVTSMSTLTGYLPTQTPGAPALGWVGITADRALGTVAANNHLPPYMAALVARLLLV